MIKSLHFSRSLNEQLSVLRHAGKKGEIAVRHFDRICSILRSAGRENEEIYLKRTKNGEYRLKHCVKYDLGGGYRLITVRLGDRLYLPFLGSHDDVDKWLDRQDRPVFEPVASAYQVETLPLTVPEPPAPAANQDIAPMVEPDAYEEALMAEIDDAVLKSIFKGLIQKQNC